MFSFPDYNIPKMYINCKKNYRFPNPRIDMIGNIRDSIELSTYQYDFFPVRKIWYKKWVWKWIYRFTLNYAWLMTAVSDPSLPLFSSCEVLVSSGSHVTIAPSPLLHTPSRFGAHLMFIKFMKISAMIYDSFGCSSLPHFPSLSVWWRIVLMSFEVDVSSI